MKVVLPLLLLSLLTAQSAIAGEGSRSAAGLDHKTEIALADTHNWVSATQNIATDADQQNLDRSQTLNPLVTVAGAKVFSPANVSNGAPRGAAKTPAPAPIYNLINHNGPILANTHLYAVWWGPTANFPAGYQSGILAALAGTACTTSTCSGMSALMNQYFPNGTRSAITYSGQYSDTSAPVTSAPTTAAIVTEVNKVVTNANLDPNGLYLVFTSNFPTKAAYCGWHGAGAVSNKWFTVSYLPNLTGQAGCAASYLPTYTANPDFCPANIEVSIKYVGVPQGTAFPSFITYNDTNIVIQTSDDMGIKAYNFEVEALDEDSGVKNTEVEFSVISAPSDVATQITLVSSTAIAD